MNKYYKIAAIIIIAYASITSKAYAFDMRYPFRDNNNNNKIILKTENFGAYRKYPNGYEEYHKGIDLSTSRNIKVYPVAAGTIISAGYNGHGYGYTIVVDHGGWQTHYSHLRGPNEFPEDYEISREEKVLKDYITKKIIVGEKVGINDWVGLEWNTGASYGKSGNHLHFGVGSPKIFDNDGRPIDSNLLNPIAIGLKQPNLDSSIKEQNEPDAYLKDVYFVDPERKEEIQTMHLNWLPGKKVRIIAEAYDKIFDGTSAPYKVVFEVTRLWGTYSETKEIKFDDLKYGNSISQKYNKIYSLEKPKISQSRLFGKKGNKFYYYWDWEPPEPGYYGVVVEVYDAYWNSGNLQIKMDTAKGTKTEGILIGLGGTFYGLSAGEEEKISVVNAETSNPILSPSPDDIDYPNHTIITAGSNMTADSWTVKIFDDGRNLIKEMSAGNNQVVNIEWDGKNASGWPVSSGTYTYQIEAKKGTDKSSFSGNIIVDRSRPAFASGPSFSAFTVQSTADAISINFTSNKELDDIAIKVYDNMNNYIGTIGNMPGLNANEKMEFNWDWAGDMPNGTYKVITYITDKVGNRNEDTKYITVNIPKNTAPPPSLEVPPQIVEGLPDLPSFLPIVSDMAIDNSGNMYVLYGRKGELVKYDSSGSLAAKIEGLRCPLGLAVSPSDDRVYVADTFNNRTLMLDGGLSILKEIKSGDVYADYQIYQKYRYFWWISPFYDREETLITQYKNPIFHYNDVYVEVPIEGYWTPSDICLNGNNVYVVDRGKHRILKYNSSLGILKYDRHLYDMHENISWPIGSGYNYLYIQSNSLNDVIDMEWWFKKTRLFGLQGYRHVITDQNYGSSDGQFTSPEAIAIDSSGPLYIADTGNNRIQKFAPDGAFLMKFGSEGSDPGQFKSPQGIYVDEDNHIWVADTGNKRIQEFKNDGTFIKSWGNAKMLSKPLKLVVKKIGRNKVVYVADGDKDKVQIFGGSPPTDFRLTQTGNQLIPSRTFTISWTTSEAEWYGLKRYEVYGRIVREGMDENDEKLWVYLKKDIPATENSAEISMWDGLYDIKVRAIDNNGNWRDSDGGSSSADTRDPSRILRAEIDAIPPLGFILEDPPDGYSVDGKDIRIAWSEAQDKNPDYYKLVVGADIDNIHGSAIYSTTFEASAAATREVWLRDLPRGKYYIYMAAYDKAGHFVRLNGTTDVAGYAWPDLASNWEGIWPSFEIDPIPPQIFTVSNIYDGQYFDSRDIKIAWTEAPDRDLDYYELYVGTDREDIIETAIYTATFEAPASRECTVNLPGGIYWIYMRAYDKLGNFRGLDGKTNASKHDLDREDNLVSFEIDHEPPVVAYNPALFPPPVTERYFSPNGDGKKDTTTINYSVGDDSYWKVNYLLQNEVSIEVKGEIVKDGQAARSWLSRAPPGWYGFEWNGTNDDGRRVEDGVYNIRITATDKALNTATNEAQWVVVDNTPPEIRNIASLGIFSPNSDGEFDTDNLSFDLTDNLSPSIASTIEVVDHDERLIANVRTGTSPVPTTSLQAIWDGRAINGWVAPDGNYRYNIVAEDLAGNASTSSALVTVDTTPPQIVDLTSDVYRLRFTETSGSLDLKFKVLEISGRANVYASILDARGSIIQNYPITAEAERQYQLSWNGRDSFGFFVPDHSYIYYRLYATDCVANKRYLDSDQLIRVETPYTGVYGNVIYSPDGELKIIIPQGALTGEAELSIEMRDTPPRSYMVQENDNITLTYEFLPEGLRFNKPCTLMFHYNPSVLNFPDQPVLPYQYSADGWKQLAGNIRNNIFTSYIDKTGAFMMGADLTPPLPPVVNQPRTPTTSDLATVSGTAEHNSTVNLNVNGRLYARVVHSPDWTISNIDLTEGENILLATARDEAGNVSRSSGTVSVYKDTIPPVLTVLNDEILYLSPNGDGTQDTVQLSASAVDAGSATCEVWLSIKNPAGREVFLERYENNFDITYGSPGLSEGVYAYNVRAEDILHNFSQRNGGLIVDKTAPYALLELRPINYYLSGNLEVWGSLEDRNFLSWIVDYGAGSSPSSYTEIARGYSSRTYGLLTNFDTHLLPSGIYTFRLSAYDGAGNVKSITKSKHIINSPINAYIFSPAVEEHVRDVVAVQGSISVPPSDFSAYYLEYGFGTSPATWSIILGSSTLPTTNNLGSWNTRGLSDGVYTLRLRAVNLGRESFTYEVPVTIDNTNPTSLISYPTGVDILGGIINVAGTAADANFTSYKIEYGEGINPLSWFEVKNSSTPVSSGALADWQTGGINGTHTVRLTTYDKAGNSSSAQVSLMMDNFIDAALTYPSTGMVLADTISIRGTASDINFAEYRLEYGTGSNPMVFTRIGEAHTEQVSAGELGSWDTRTVADGTYTLRLVVIDQAGNEVKKTVTIIVDNTYPTVAISSPSAGNYLAGVVNIAGTAYDDNIQSYLLEYQDNSVPGTWHYIYSTLEAQNIQGGTIFNWGAGSLNGPHTIKIAATDKTGKTSNAQVSVILDNIRPVISITSPARESVNTGRMDMVGEISDINLKNYSIKYGAGIEPTQSWELKSSASSLVGTLYTWQTTNVKDGYYTLKYEAEDQAGNKSSYEFPIIIDNAPAIAEIQEPIANQVIRGTVDIKGVACDADFTTYNFKRYEVLYGQGASPTSWTTIESLVVPKINETLTSWNTIGLPDGTYTIKLRSQDVSGITEKTRTVIVDNTSPSLSIASPSDGATVSGNVSITGTATDANLTEYKVYYRNASSGDWTQISSSLPATWDSRLVGDGSYVIKLWARDKAGNEHEIVRNITVNNTLDVNKVSLSSSAFSPNGDGIDDRLRIKYNLTEPSNVTVKIYKKPSTYIYNWAAFASGTRYPRQDFFYTLSASGTDHPPQYFNYTLTASGTKYEPQPFGWRVDGSGTETWYILTSIDTGNVSGGSQSANFTANFDQTCSYSIGAGAIPVEGSFAGANVRNETDNVYIDSIVRQYPPGGGGSKSGTFSARSGKLYSATAAGYNSGSARAVINYQIRNSPPVSASDSGTDAIISYDGTISGRKTYSVTLSPLNGGTISGHTISYTQTSNTSGVRSERDSSGWSGDTISGVINATYIYPGVSWSGSNSPTNRSCASGPGSPSNYSASIGSLITVNEYVPSPTFTLSSPTGSGAPNVWLRFSDTSTSTTTNRSASVIGSTTFTTPWNPDPVGGAGSCTPGPGAPTNYSSAISGMITVPTTVSGPTFTLSGNANSNVSLRFSDTGTSTTTNPNTSVVGSTSYTEPWTTANHTGGVVGADGWIRWGPYSLPFAYNEAPESKNVRTITGYAPPSDVVISSWAVNPDNTYPTISGANANGDFNVRLADDMLVKTLQYDTLTTAGEHTIEWDGADNSGTTVSDGDYIYVIYAGGNTVKKGINGEYAVEVKQSSEITGLSVSESYISPNGDGLKDNANIIYNLSRPANSVSVEIRDKDTNLIRTLSGPAEAGTQTVPWDGRDTAGAVAKDGIYAAKVIAAHSGGAAREKSIQIRVDNNNPPVSDEEPQAIVDSSAWEEDPVYSPDKTKVAYVKEISGQKQIAVFDLTTYQPNQLTTAGNNFAPGFSPDGSKIVFISDRSGNQDIWIMNADGSGLKQLTANSASESAPLFSPDGRKIIHASNREGQLLLPKWNIWTISTDGSNPAQITKDENTFMDGHPSPSPDGKKITYSSDQDGGFDIWAVNSDGGSKVKVSSSSEAESQPSWSPDGLRVAYKNERGVAIYDVKARIHMQEISAAEAANPSWSRDGTEIIYNDNAGNIYSKPTYKGALTGIITYPILSQTLSGLVEVKGTALDTNLEGYKVEYSPNTTPCIWTEIGRSSIPKKEGVLAVWNTAPLTDGQYLLRLTVWDKAGNSMENSLVVNSDNDNWKLTIGELTQITTSDAWDIEPSWSPDGTKLAFSSNRSGDYDIWLMNPAEGGTGLTNLSNNPAYDGKPIFSPDGTKIAFVSDRSGNSDIWVMNIDGSNLSQLTNLTIMDTDPCWSPDGTKLAFAGNRSDNFDIWVVNSDGSGSPVKLTSSEAYEGEPSWSRFGLAFTSDRSGNKEIWMVNPAEGGTGEPFRLTNNSAEDKEPCWSPFAIPLSDGSSRPLITFTSTRQNNDDIYVMDTDGIDQSKSLTDYTNTDCNPAWSPDGRRVAFASFKDGQYDIWVMDFGINVFILSVPAAQQADADMKIISPKDSKRIENLRPTFEWYGIRGHTSYRIVAKKDIETWTQPKNITQTAASPESGARPAIAYAIHEFDNGLSRGIWNWKVQALNSDNSVLAETAEESFEIDQPFSITGITNFPNPFNPNRERTSIRYRLGRDADEVKIRIYDITGALVNELEGTTNAESVNIWSKYNDIYWDGRNGRGDKVLNGIYPFEVVARVGNRSVSGRGKIAILK